MGFIATSCLSLSYLFPRGFFFFFICLIRVGVTQLVFEFPSEGSIVYVAIGLVCRWEEVSSGDSYVAILNWNSQKVTVLI